MATIGTDLIAPLTEMNDFLDKFGPVEQMQLLELQFTRFCLHALDKQEALKMADGLHKHVRQLIEQAEKELGAFVPSAEDTNSIVGNLHKMNDGSHRRVKNMKA